MIKFSPAKNSRTSKSKRRREFRNSRQRINQPRGPPEELNNRDLNGLCFFRAVFIIHAKCFAETRRKGRKRLRRIAHYARMVRGRAFDHRRWRKPVFDIWTMCIQHVQKSIRYVANSIYPVLMVFFFSDIGVRGTCAKTLRFLFGCGNWICQISR